MEPSASATRNSTRAFSYDSARNASAPATRWGSDGGTAGSAASSSASTTRLGRLTRCCSVEARLRGHHPRRGAERSGSAPQGLLSLPFPGGPPCGFPCVAPFPPVARASAARAWPAAFRAESLGIARAAPCRSPRPGRPGSRRRSARPRVAAVVDWREAAAAAGPGGRRKHGRWSDGGSVGSVSLASSASCSIARVRGARLLRAGRRGQQQSEHERAAHHPGAFLQQRSCRPPSPHELSCFRARAVRTGTATAPNGTPQALSHSPRGLGGSPPGAGHLRTGFPRRRPVGPARAVAGNPGLQ